MHSGCALMPNIFPLVVVGAVIGFSSIALDGSIAIIFTIGFVIAVDDTIHFLSKYIIGTGKGEKPARCNSYNPVTNGKPIVMTSIILFFGYFILLLSPFRETYYYGLLLTITILLAVIADLFVMPAIMQFMLRSRDA